MELLPSFKYLGPIPNMSNGGMNGPILGLILHVMEGSYEGTNNWFHNPAAEASAHLGAAKDGRAGQWVPLDDKAWAEVSGNPSYASIENEGYMGQSLTLEQLHTCACALAYLHIHHDVPLALANHPGERGLGYHSMGGASWGGHPCPGAPIVAQRPQILQIASDLINPRKQEETEMITYLQANNAIYVLSPDNTVRHIGPAEWTASQPILKAGRGILIPVPSINGFPVTK